jgi:hypothetical protein
MPYTERIEHTRLGRGTEPSQSSCRCTGHDEMIPRLHHPGAPRHRMERRRGGRGVG